MEVSITTYYQDDDSDELIDDDDVHQFVKTISSSLEKMRNDVRTTMVTAI
jgi:hypothetical protein